MRQPTVIITSHLIVREKGVLCTRCFITEPVHCGQGTPMGTFIIALEALAYRHQNCSPGQVGDKESKAKDGGL